MNSRSKGKRGELEAVQLLKRFGFHAKRGQQHKGGPDSPDLICEDLPDYHIEVKRTERLDLYGALQQATQDSRIDQVPVVLHRKNQQGWVVVVDAEHWLWMVTELKNHERLCPKPEWTVTHDH